MSILKKIWTELTRVRSIEFHSYKTNEEKEKKFRQELQNRITEIQIQNYKKIMTERLIPYCRDLELSSSGLLLSDKQLLIKAHTLFVRAKLDGKLDELNALVKEEK